VDNNLDTELNAYRYKIEFIIEGGRLLGTTPPASSVRFPLLLTTKDAVEVEANVRAVGNDNQRHRIYRETCGTYNAIAEVDVLGGFFNYIGRRKIKYQLTDQVLHSKTELIATWLKLWDNEKVLSLGY
jgi:hypothetical protein